MNEPRYDEDGVNLGYLKKVINGTEDSINEQYGNISRHYASKPNTPYYKGDTWIDGNIVYICINTRKIGNYNDSDWVSESGAKELAFKKNRTFLTQPSDYEAGDMWILQSDNDHKAGKKGEILISTAGRKVYDEGDWINMLGYGTISSINEVANNLSDTIDRIGVVEESISDGIITTYYQNTIPETTCIGDLWYVTDNIDYYIKGKIYRYDGETWNLLDDPDITKAFEEANEARIVADGKIQSFYSETEPTEDIGIGDLWIDLSDKNKLYRYNGTNWVAVYDTRIDEVIEDVETVTRRTVEISTDLGKITNTVAQTTTKVTTLENTVKHFSVDLSQYNILIPTDNTNKPLSTNNYNVNFYAYFKGQQVTPSVTITGINTGISATKTNTYIRFAVNSNTPITSLLNDYSITFSYEADDIFYEVTKKVDVALAIQGSNGTGVTILGSYNTYEELVQAHPTGSSGDSYIVNGNLYVWDDKNNSWTNVGNIQGPQGVQGPKGDTGPQGIQGEPGINGTSTYFHVKYSANSNGNPMTDSPTSITKYIGVASTTSPTAPSSYSGYVWSLIKGQDGTNGTPGQPGSNGQTSYLHIKYSEDGITFTPAKDGYAIGEKPSAYIGQYVDFTQADSSNFNNYTWYKFTEDIDPVLNSITDKINTKRIQSGTTIELETEPADNQKPIEFKVDGRSEQATRSGKNLLNQYNILNHNDWVNIDITNLIKKNNPFYANVKLKNLVATPSAEMQLRIDYKLNGATKYIFGNILQEDGLLYIDNKVIEDFDEGTTVSLVIKWGDKPDTITYDLEDFYFSYIDNEYEPYGASPSPEFPSPIESIGDDVNLLSDNYDDYFKEDYATYKIGELGENYTVQLIDNDTTVDISGLYVLMFDNQTYATSTIRKGIISNGDISNNLNNGIYTNNDFNYLGIYPNTQEAFNKFFQRFKIKVQKGTVATPYSPYNIGSLVIEQIGKNEIDVKDINITHNGITFNGDNNGKINISGTATNTFAISNYVSMEIEKGTYTFSLKESITEIIILWLYNAENTLIATFKSNGTKTITIQESVSKYRIAIEPLVSGNTYNIDIYPMLEKNDTSTDYEEYKQTDYIFYLSQPLRSLPNGVRDTLEEDGIHRRVGEIILDGSDDEGWHRYNNMDNDISCWYQSMSYSDLKVINALSRDTLISNLFDTYNCYGANQTKNGICYHADRRFQIRIERELLNPTSDTDIESFKTWLAQNSVTVQYELAEEVIEPYDEYNQSVMDELKMYSWIKHISNSEDANMEISYYKATDDLDPRLDSLQNEIDINSENINSANNDIGSLKGAVETNKTVIEQLSNMISNLVTVENEDGSRGSLMTQVDGGWTFNMSSINESLETIKNAMATMETNNATVNSSLEKLSNLIQQVAENTAYIVMATDENGNPCIELGKTDTPEGFKVRITNTAIDFLEGSTKIAYANNNTFYCTKIIVRNELQIGEGPGYVWRTRENGNMGLVYISE